MRLVNDSSLRKPPQPLSKRNSNEINLNLQLRPLQHRIYLRNISPQPHHCVFSALMNHLTHRLLRSIWFTAEAFPCCASWFILLWWSESCDISPSTLTFVYWLLTGGCGLLLLLLLLFLSPLDDDLLLKKFRVKNSFVGDSFLTLFAPSLLFVSDDPAPDPLWFSDFFIVIVITKFGFTSCSSSRVCRSCVSIKRFKILFSVSLTLDFGLQRENNFFLINFFRFTTARVHVRMKTEPLRWCAPRHHILSRYRRSSSALRQTLILSKTVYESRFFLFVHRAIVVILRGDKGTSTLKKFSGSN